MTLYSPYIKEAITHAYEQLEALPELFYECHDFAYWPVKYSDDTGPLSPSKGSSRPPGRGEVAAVGAYRSASQDLARAYFDCVKVALNVGVSIPPWPAADDLVPHLTTVPSPSELARGVRAIKLALLRLYFLSATNLAVLTKRNTLVDGPAFLIDRAHRRLRTIILTPSVPSSKEDVKQAVEMQLKRYGRDAV